MLLPSLHKASEPDHAWNVTHAACYGAIIGALAALFKTMGPLRPSAAIHWAGNLTEVVSAALAFALLCAAAAMLRNYLFRRLLSQQR